ncbi:MAG: HAD family hydrolase [Anaerolineae bacterium]|nr:HAD family hydrolase [Anaerolineae bacterium]
MSRLKIIAFDADDTLWHNEYLYQNAQTRFKTLLSQYHSPEWIDDHLFRTEMRNIRHYGYGIKSFTLSMVETALELTRGRITGADIQTVLDLGKEMLTAQVELIENVTDIVARLAATHTLIVITKGDLRDQETKMARSGLESHFAHIEVVSDKTPALYKRLMYKHNTAPDRFLMVGNSLRSDILPVLELGATAVYIPHQLTWAHENAERPVGHAGYYELENIGMLPALVSDLERE